MPLGIVNDEDFDQELLDQGLGNKVNTEPIRPEVIIPEIITPNTPGRRPGDNNVPDTVRQFIAEAGLLGASNAELSQLMNVSQSSVSAYKHGATSTATYHDKKPSIVNHLNKAKERISRKARRVLNDSLDELTPEKLRSVKAKDNAIIARAMASIVKEMEPEVKIENNDNRVQFVMFAPAIRAEKHYDAIDVQALDGD